MSPLMAELENQRLDQEIIPEPKEPQRERGVLAQTQEWLDNLFVNNAGEIEEQAPASEMIMSCFIFGCTGIKIPTNQQERACFVKGFAISTALSGGHTPEAGASGGNIETAARVAVMGDAEARRYKQSFDDKRFNQGEITIDNVTNGNESPVLSNEYDSKISSFLENLRIDRSVAVQLQSDILKIAGLYLIKELNTTKKDDLDEAKKCLDSGREEEGFQIIEKLVRQSAENQLIDRTIERVCNDWKTQVYDKDIDSQFK